jgi:hypothetical protein
LEETTAAAQVGKPQLQFGVRQRPVNLPVEFVDYLGRRVFACTDTNPCSRVVTRHKLAQRRDIRHSAADYGRRLEEEAEKWGKVIRAANIKAE